MQVEVIDNIDALSAVKGDWEAVYDADPEAHYFMSWTWMSKWLREMSASWIVLAVRSDGEGDGHVAFFPLRVEINVLKKGGFFTDLQGVCQGALDWTSLICRPEHEAEAVPAFAAWLKGTGWSNVLLLLTRMSERRLRLFLDAFPDRDFDHYDDDAPRDADTTDHRINLALDLPDDWDSFLDERLSAKTRHRVRNYLRKVDSADRFTLSEPTAATIDRDLDIVLDLWGQRWGEMYGRGLAGVQRTDRIMLRYCFDEGVLFMPMLWEGDRPLGGVATVVDRRHKTMLFRLIARDETFRNPSPGVILIAAAIRHAIAEGMARCDFLQGNHAYKYAFGVEERLLKNVRVSRKSKRRPDADFDKTWLAMALPYALYVQRQGMFDVAEACYRQMLRLDPRFDAARRNLAEVMALTGRHAAAKRLLKTAPAGAVPAKAPEGRGDRPTSRAGAKRT